MREIPILFSGEMVRAILEGRKTQTRRIVKMPEGGNDATLTRMQDGFPDGTRPIFGIDGEPNAFSVPCPQGQPGDRLWVRETWRATCTKNGAECIEYRADDSARIELSGDSGDVSALGPECIPIEDGPKWRPSIFMPRWVSRLTLEITAVKVERLQDISVEDALAEGVNLQEELYPNIDSADKSLRRFPKLWDSINGKTCPWKSNPFVWAITFKRI